MSQRTWELVVSGLTLINILLYGQGLMLGAISGILLIVPWGLWTWRYKMHGLWPLNIGATIAHTINLFTALGG